MIEIFIIKLLRLLPHYTIHIHSLHVTLTLKWRSFRDRHWAKITIWRTTHLLAQFYVRQYYDVQINAHQVCWENLYGMSDDETLTSFLDKVDKISVFIHVT